MYIGFNDKDLHKQVISDEAFYQVIARYIDSCTIFPAIGLYHGELEKSIKLEIYDEDVEKYIEIAKKLCVELNQNEIIVNGEFIENITSKKGTCEWIG